MAELYLYLFILICIALLGWGLARPQRIYQYPFFMGGIFVAFILPQAIALLNSPYDPVNQKALERVLLMSCLCAFMCWFGYQLPCKPSLTKKLDISVDSKKFFYGGIVLVLIAYFSQFLILQLPSALREQTQWTGIITIYAFFRNLIYPGFSILLLSTLQRSTVFKFILTAFASALPLQLIIFEGRREPTATFIITLGLCFYYTLRYIPPRWLVISLIVFTLFAIPLTATYRNIAKTGDWNKLTELQPIEYLQNYVEKAQILELRNAALLMDAAVKTRQYGYGTDYWNKLVFSFVPAQLVGRDLKNSLMIKLYEYDLNRLYNYKIHTGNTTTGIGDSFIQFDYFGCIFFGLLSYFFKIFWISSSRRKILTSQIFYISLFAPSMLCVTHGTVNFISDVLFNLIFIGLIILYSRKKNIQTYSSFSN